MNKPSPDPLALAVEKLETSRLHSNPDIAAQLVDEALAALRRARERAEAWYILREERGEPAIVPFGLAGAGDNLAIYSSEGEARAALESGMWDGCTLHRVLVVDALEAVR